jgi:hypothetical protein
VNVNVDPTTASTRLLVLTLGSMIRTHQTKSQVAIAHDHSASAPAG